MTCLRWAVSRGRRRHGTLVHSCSLQAQAISTAALRSALQEFEMGMEDMDDVEGDMGAPAPVMSGDLGARCRLPLLEGTGSSQLPHV